MNKAIFILSIFLFASSVVLAACPCSADNPGAGANGIPNQEGQGNMNNQQQGPEEVISVSIEGEDEEEVPTDESGETEEDFPGSIKLETVKLRVKSMQELRECVQVRKEELKEEADELKGRIREVRQNQNEVRLAVHSLLAMEDLAGGIGKQVSEIAKEFNNSVRETIQAEEKIQKRSGFVKFFIGGDQEAAGILERETNMNQLRLEQLRQLRDNCDCSDELKAMIQEQIQNMEQEQNRLEEVAKGEQSRRGIFGWFINLFK